MNHIYRVIYNTATQTWQVTSELAKTGGKGCSSITDVTPFCTLNSLASKGGTCLAMILYLLGSYTFAQSSCASAGSTIMINANEGQCRPKTDDKITINSSGSVSSSNDAVFLYANGVAINDIELTNHGTIHADREKGISLLSRNGGSTSVSNLTNETTGVISANRSSAIKNNGNRIGTIINKGEIFSKQYAIYNYKGYIGLIKNTGNIAAQGLANSNYGIRNERQSTINTIDNAGLITAQDRYAIANLSGSTINTIENQGTLAAKRQTIANYATIGVINNKGQIKATQSNAIYNAKNISGITNHRGATISARNNAIFSVGNINSIHNNGVINANKHTIINYGIVDEISNGGKITSAESIAIYNSKEISKIVNNNNGVISAKNYTLVNRGKINILENKGVLQTTLGGNAAVAIRSNYNNSVLATLNNHNLIDGKIETKGTELNLFGNNARITGDVTNTGGSINIKSGAQFTSEASFDSQSFVIDNNATFQLGDSSHLFTVTGTSSDAFNNSGTFVVSNNQTATITGNYRQTGAFRLGANSTTYGRIAVSGDVDITSSATFDVDVANGTTTIANGGILAGVISSSGTLTNTSPSNNVTDNSYLFDFTSRTNANGQQIDLISNYTFRINPATTQHGLCNGVPAAQIIDGYIRGGATGTDWDDVVSALARLPDSHSTAAAVGDMMPLLHGNTALAGLINSKAAEGIVSQRQATLSASSGDVLAEATFWVRPFGQWADQDQRGCVNGFNANSHGIMMGLENDFSAHSTLGFGFGYTDSSAHGKGFASNHRTTAKALTLMAYGQHDLSSNWQLAWQGDYTRSQVDGSRHIGFINRTANSDFEAQALHLGAEISKDILLGAQTSLRPKAGLDWRHYKADGYTETGADSLNLIAQSQSTQEAILSIGAELSHEVDAKTELFGHIDLGYDLIGDDQAVTAQFTGGGAAFITPGIDSRRVNGEAGVGVRYRPNEQSEISLQYNLLTKSGYIDHSANLQFGWKF